MNPDHNRQTRRARRRAANVSARLRPQLESLEQRHLLTGFVAYNGLSPGAAPHPNVTFYADRIDQDAAGPLLDFATGESTSVLLSTSQVGVIYSGSGDAPAEGTDAFQTFGSAIDFLSERRTIELNGDDAYRYAFENLDPGATYQFSGTAVRGTSTFTDRWVLVEIVGAASFTPAHSAGLGVVTGGLLPSQVALWTGDNSAANQGFLAQWTEIDPGDDGQFEIVCSQYKGPIPRQVDSAAVADGSRAYAITAIRLIEDTASGPPVIQNTAPAEVGAYSALVGSNLLQSGGQIPAGKLYYGRSDGGTDAGSWEQLISIDRLPRDWSYLLGDLQDNTQYFYRTFAENSLGQAWAAETSTFTTLPAGPPVVSLLPVGTVGSVSAELLGRIDDTGNDPPLVTLFYGDHEGGANPDDWEHALDLGLQTGDFTAALADLRPTTTYFYAARATNGLATVWTSPASFTTREIPPLLISEFMADNKTIVRTRVRAAVDQPYGDILTPDWIELRNTTAADIDLSGMYLSQDRSDPTQWQIPEGTLIAANGYLLVFASGLNVRDTNLDQEGVLHTNFSITAGAGQSLVLADTNGDPIYELSNSPLQFEDISYGIDSFDAVRYFVAPTPGAANAVTSPRGPTFSVTSRTFSEPFSLELFADQPNQVIYFTTDERAPTVSSTRYTGPLLISRSTEVRAIAVAPNGEKSRIVSQTFVQMARTITNVTSNLPLLIVETFGDAIGTTFADAFVALIEPGADGRSSLSGEFSLQTRAGIHVRGSSSSGFSKKQYRVEFRDEREEDLKLNVLGMPRESDWIFYGPGEYDRALINNPLMYDLSNQMGRYAPRTRWVEVYLNSNGSGVTSTDYLGLYVIMEVVKSDDDRLPVGSLSTGAGGQPVTGGFIWKNDRGNAYVDPEQPNSAQTAYINSWLNGLRSAAAGANAGDPAVGFAKWADVGSFIDHNILNLLAMNVDALRLSSYYYKTPDGKLEAGPIWDFDRALDSTDGRDNSARTWYGSGDSTRYFNDSDRVMSWWPDMFQDPGFVQAYIDRWFELRQGVLSLDNVFATMDAHAAQIREASVRNYSRWAGSRYRDLAGEIDHMKSWLKSRLEWIDSRWLGPPQLDIPAGVVPAGTEVTVSGPEGIVYYTLDGSDPRGADGAVTPAALVADGPLTIAHTATLTVRVFNPDFGRSNGYVRSGDDWSAPTVAVFVTDPPATADDLAISEIHFNPLGPDLQKGEPDVDNDEFEFVEIVNVANHAVDLRGVQLVETDEGGQLHGVRFTFESQILQPRAAIVVVENVQAFQARYGDAIPIALGRDQPADDEGEYGGKLSNAGDLLTLLDAQGNLIRQFMYDDKWQPTSDGEGRSLELTQVWQNERAELERGSLWQASGVIGGTPGQAIGFGDLNVDREVSLSDIDLLFAVMAHFSAEAAPRWFDLNVDDKVDSQDALRLVTDALGTRPGDADLDGNVDFDDFVTLANRFGQRATSWAEGDFDGSGDVAFADFVLLANNFGFVRPAQPLPDQTALSIDLAAALAAEQQKKES